MEYKVIKFDDEEYPKLLRKIENPPKQLYIAGNSNLLNEDCFSIIGSRSCTKRGIEVAKSIAKELVKYNLCITSGLALGIDTAAHRGALIGGGKTIAVLGSGLKHIYPKENINLAESIIKSGGAIITEYEPNEIAKSTNFPQRNRIVSGLSIGTLVVEAHYRSGTTITARLAEKQGRKVFAIPNTIDNKYGTMTNELIKNGAILTRSAEDIVKEYYFLEKNENICIENSILIEMPEEYKEIYEIIKKDEVHIEAIVRKLNKSISEVNSIITMMELEGYIESMPGNFYRRKECI